MKKYRWTKKRIRQWLLDVVIIWSDNQKEARSMLDFLIKELEDKC